MENSATASADNFLRGLWKENPVFVTMLGICPTLAVTSSAANAVAMGASTLFVLVCSNALISLLRNLIPNQVRIATYVVVIATFVTVVDYTLQATTVTIYESLGPFIQLIVVNCIILGRAEAFASRNGLTASILDGAGAGLGFTLALLCIGSVREILGAGALFGIPLFGAGFQPWLVMILPPGGFFVLGLWLLLFAAWRERRAGLDAKGAALHAR